MNEKEEENNRKMKQILLLIQPGSVAGVAVALFELLLSHQNTDCCVGLLMLFLEC